MRVRGPAQRPAQRAGKFLLAGLAALAAGGGARAAEAGPRDDGLDVWRSAVEHGIVNFALEPLKRLYEKPTCPDRAEVALLLARCRFRLRQYGEAARLLDGYGKEFPDAGRFYLAAAYWLARADIERARRADTGDEHAKLVERARKGFARVLDESIEPRLLEGSRFFIGVALFEASGYSPALTAFMRAKELGVPYSETENLALYIGRTHLKLRNFAEAAGEFRRFLGNFPRSRNLPEAFYGLGEAHYYVEEWTEAGGAYRRSGEAAARRNDAEAVARSRYARGWALTKLGEKRALAGDEAGAAKSWSEALREFESLADCSNRVVRTASVFESGEILFRLGRYGEAAERLLGLTDPDRHPDHAAPTLYLLGRSRIALKQLPEAAEALRRALEAGARGDLARRVRFALAEALVEDGQAESARDALVPLTRADRTPSVRAEARFEMARIARRAGSVALREHRPAVGGGFYAQAYEILQALTKDASALAELPADKVAYWRGRSADDRGRLESEGSADGWFERALEAYRAVRTHTGWNVWAERSLTDEAELHAYRGNLDEAVRAYRELLSRDLSPGVELDARLRLADAELERGEHSAAREAVEPVLTEEHLSARRDEAAYKIAVALSRGEGALEAATESFREFLRRFPGSGFAPHARAGLGDCISRAGRYAEAAAQYERVLADFPGYAERDRVELAAGDARRAAGETEAAAAHYRSLFRRGRSNELRARARLEEGRLERAAGRLREALDLAEEAIATAREGRVAHEAAELRGMVLFSLGRFEAASRAFAGAAEEETGPFRARVKSLEAGALLAWGRSGALTRPNEVLRRAARTFTEAYYISDAPGLKDGAIFRAADALVELAAVEEEGGRGEAGARELKEARRLLDLVSERSKARARLRIEEIEERLRALGRPR